MSVEIALIYVNIYKVPCSDLICSSILKNTNSSHALVPMKPGSYSHCAAGRVLILAWVHRPMPGPEQALTAPPAASQGSALVSVSKGSFRTACACADPPEAFQRCFESLTKEAESPMHVLLVHSSKKSFFF